MLKINSIFLSINGECCRWGQGSWAVFIRTAGCSENCSYCDTLYAKSEDAGEVMTSEEILKIVERISPNIKRVTITGGEPLEQVDLPALLYLLTKKGYEISVETNGRHFSTLLSLQDMFPDVSWVVDYKLPSSGNVGSISYLKFYLQLRENSISKFVISDEKDFRVALGALYVFSYKFDFQSKIYFSPAESLDPAKLFGWMKSSNLCMKMDVGFSYQLHKVIFKDARDEEGNFLGVGDE